MKQKLLFLTLIVFGTACSSTTTGKFPDLTKMISHQVEEVPTANKVHAPEWTVIESGAYQDVSGEAVFYGLGSVSKDENSQDSKTLSEDRARDELAKVFTSYMERLVEGVSKSKPDSSVTNNTNKDQLSSSIEESIATIMMETKITNHWLDPDNGKVYSMAKLDLSRLTDKLDSFDKVSTEDKSFLKNTIIQAHTSMTNEFASRVALSVESVEVSDKKDRILSY
jgi:hypothetical protein